MGDTQPTHEVFISYATADKPWADAACAVLEAHRIRCWIAPRDITPGTEWGASIIAGIDGCKIMVLIFSAHANESPQVRREVERVISKGLTLLPCRIEDVRPVGAMEFALSNTHWLDAFTPPVERQMKLLAESVQALLHTWGIQAQPKQSEAKKSDNIQVWCQPEKPKAAPVSAAQVTGGRWFRYEAMNTRAEEVEDCIDATDEEDAQRKIRQLGYFVTKLTEVRDEQTASLSELAVLFRHFAAYMRQGLRVLHSLRLLLQKLTLSLPLATALQHVVDRIECGDTLSRPMKAYPQVFPRWVVNLVKSGESNGALELNLERIAFLTDYESGPEEKPVLAAWCRHFATAVGGGVAIFDCLSCLREMSRFRSLEAATKDIYESIQEGGELSDAMARHPHLFPRWVVDRIAEGETTGDIDEELERIAAQLEGR
jgi:hypothetical protein